jgi:hypothetical protein
LSPLALKIKNINNESVTTRNLESQNETISTTATSTSEPSNLLLKIKNILIF